MKISTRSRSICNDRLVAAGWTQTDARSGVDQEALEKKMYVGIGRNLDGLVVLQDTDPVRLWTEFFERIKLYCCG